ncbi:Sbal_3080 family lipoprotein [Methylomicrobium lacus]|uniref:Sbal_3080 family lipoprotein n=1 Tax=Methylomicrobium lacus TaxID=136992 RepID=UPI0035A976F3
MKKTAALTSALLLGACASPLTRIEPVPATENISQICIKENTKVFMDDFLPEVRKQIEERNIKTELLTPNAVCEYVMSYDAQWSWDWFWTFSVYLSLAEFSVTKNNQQIGMASYTAGLGPAAIGRTQNKIRPLLIELFRK